MLQEPWVGDHSSVRSCRLHWKAASVGEVVVAADGERVRGELVTEHAPSTVHDLLYEGAIRAFTERHAEQPEQVLAYQAEVRRVAGLADNGGVNGVRIGLQRALGYDLRRAIEVGQRYPEEVQPAILEELGMEERPSE